MLNETFRFGSARWPRLTEIENAGLLPPKPDSPPLGFIQDRPLCVSGDSPLITVAGSGAGKARDVLVPLICSAPSDMNMLILDLKGELGAVSMGDLVRQGKAGYFINAFGMHGLPQHRFNPLDVLRAGSVTRHQDAKVCAEALIKSSGGGHSDYFEGRARELVEKGAKYLVLRQGQVTLPELYRLLCLIDGNPEGWQRTAEDMMRCGLDDVRQVVGEMLYKQQSAPGEFSAIMGTLHKNLNFVTDPAIERTLSGGDFSLEVLADPALRCHIHIIVPAEYVGVLSSFLRLTFAVATLYKQQAPQAPPLYLLCDESAQLGHFEALERCVTYGRGAKIRTHTVWQDLGQISRHYGPNGLQTFLGSSQVRQFFSIRDIQSARLISEMLGTQTLEYNDTLQQERARRAKLQALNAMMFGGADPLLGATEVAHHARAQRHRTKQARALMTPSEVMALPEDQQLLFISGVNCPQILADRRAYFRQPALAGRYLANPYHEEGFVQIATRRGTRRARIITEACPREIAHFPQYAAGPGTWQYVEGYRPDLSRHRARVAGRAGSSPLGRPQRLPYQTPCLQLDYQSEE
ncbi:MAG: type IV secretory system conjugative DNA transfer family protein [Alphaproteobacteria bacterium]|nr:type IV secretory system conjugative DNA transfer family protein [Alphaproteobacteria bacterium]